MGNRSGRRDGLHEVLGRSLHAGGAGNGGAHRARWWALRPALALLIGLAVLAALWTPAQFKDSS